MIQLMVFLLPFNYTSIMSDIRRTHTSPPTSSGRHGNADFSKAAEQDGGCVSPPSTPTANRATNGGRLGRRPVNIPSKYKKHNVDTLKERCDVYPQLLRETTNETPVYSYPPAGLQAAPCTDKPDYHASAAAMHNSTNTHETASTDANDYVCCNIDDEDDSAIGEKAGLASHYQHHQHGHSCYSQQPRWDLYPYMQRNVENHGTERQRDILHKQEHAPSPSL
ncbi:hypothetical protein BDF19DRAFT_430819 [Syncephalis fuscata]|nr:hypothetical protein BDF19DRAFT_430819 [Syncephalis fuscata]